MKSIREDLRIIWKHINRCLVSQGKLILKEKEIDLRGRVAGWRKKRASAAVSD